MSDQAGTRFRDLAAVAAGDQHEQAVLELRDIVDQARRRVESAHPDFLSGDIPKPERDIHHEANPVGSRSRRRPRQPRWRR